MFPRAPLPEHIGAYRVIRRLPSPGGADLYLCREEGPLGFARTVVLKLAPLSGDTERAEELAREASAVARLNHPSILRMFNFFQDGDRLVLVLEHVEGTSLARVMQSLRRRGLTLPDEVVFYVAHRLCAALAQAHSMTDEKGARTPVVHRAITPASLQVAWDGTVRLSGYGLAKIMGLSPDTALGLVKGAPGYMAPEQLRGERITERVDIYQAGLLIWEMLAGNPPPTAGLPRKTRQVELVQMVSGNRLASVAMVRPSIPREIAAIVDAALEPSVEKRTVTAAELERWLAKTVDTEGGRDALRKRATLVRSSVARSMPSMSDAAPRPGIVRGKRVALPRFPGNAVRATGRPSLTDASEHVSMMPTRRPPPARAGASAPPPRSLRPGVGAASGQGAAQQSSHRISGQELSVSTRLPTAAVTPPPAPPTSVPVELDVADVLSDEDVFAMTPPPGLPRLDGPVLPSGSTPRLDGGRASIDTLPPSPKGPRRHALLVAGGVAVLAAGILTLVALSRSSGDAKSALVEGGSAASAPVAPSPLSAMSAAPEPVAIEAVAAERTEPPLPPLPYGMAALRMKPDVSGYVFVNGKRYGETGHTLVVPCGQRHVRVGAHELLAGHVLWLTEGESVRIPCGKFTEISAPSREPAPKPPSSKQKATRR